MTGASDFNCSSVCCLGMTDITKTLPHELAVCLCHAVMSSRVFLARVAGGIYVSEAQRFHQSLLPHYPCHQMKQRSSRPRHNMLKERAVCRTPCVHRFESSEIKDPHETLAPNPKTPCRNLNVNKPLIDRVPAARAPDACRHESLERMLLRQRMGEGFKFKARSFGFSVFDGL